VPSAISQNLVIFPNPGTGLFSVNYELDPNTTKAELSVIDVTGKEIKHILLEGSNGLTNLNLEGLSDGTYQCILLVNDKVIGTQKIVLIK